MSGLRQQYFNELLRDCQEACKTNNVDADDQAIIIAALIFSDSLNGLRKAILTPNYIVPRAPDRF